MTIWDQLLITRKVRFILGPIGFAVAVFHEANDVESSHSSVKGCRFVKISRAGVYFLCIFYGVV